MMLADRSIRFNSWRWRPILEKWRHLRIMIDPLVLMTATFLTVDNEKGQPQPKATVFFIRWNFSSGINAYYAVTAAHAIEPIVSIRFNLRNGGTQDQAFTADEWVMHPTSDIAVLPLPSDCPLGTYNIDYIAIHHFAGATLLPAQQTKQGGWTLNPAPFGAGDEVFSIGLFEGHSGQHLAQPVARFGHVALNPAPGEKVLAAIDLTEDENAEPELKPINAFLVEMATWQGQSGSPVFLRLPAHENAEFWWGDSYCLLGMVQGFYPGEQHVLINNKDAALAPLQMGIGLVIPCSDILDTLSDERLKEHREKLKKDKEQNPKIRPSAASVNTTDEKK